VFVLKEMMTSLFRSFGVVRSSVTLTRQFQSSASLWDRQTGKVKWFDRSKGFGFITPVDGSAEVFVHFSGIQSSGYKTLRDGENVEYDLEEYAGKTRATKVTGPGGVELAGSPPPQSEFQQRAPRQDRNFQPRQYNNRPRQDRHDKGEEDQ